MADDEHIWLYQHSLDPREFSLDQNHQLHRHNHQHHNHNHLHDHNLHLHHHLHQNHMSPSLGLNINQSILNINVQHPIPQIPPTPHFRIFPSHVAAQTFPSHHFHGNNMNIIQQNHMMYPAALQYHQFVSNNPPVASSNFAPNPTYNLNGNINQIDHSHTFMDLMNQENDDPYDPYLLDHDDDINQLNLNIPVAQQEQAPIDVITPEPTLSPTPSQSSPSPTPSPSPQAAAAIAAADSSPTPRPSLECHICLDSPREPVVTLCGHLFCWRCLYVSHSMRQVCPVCKAKIAWLNEMVVPIYGQDHRENNEASSSGSGIPPRPRPYSRPPVISLD